MKNIPKKIYLQVGDVEDLDISFKELRGITWSTERIDSSDIEYILNGNTEKRESEAFCQCSQLGITIYGEDCNLCGKTIVKWEQNDVVG